MQPERKANRSFTHGDFRKINPWGRVLLEKLIFAEVVKTFATVYGKRRFIMIFTGARHFSLY
jgi:hypothetical protein